MEDLETKLKTAVEVHKRGQLAEADHLYNEILLAYPGHADTSNFLAALKGQSGNPEEGCRLLQAIVDKKPDDLRSRVNLGRLMEMKGDLEGAEDCYRKNLEFAPDHLGSLAFLSKLLKDTGRIEEAISHYHRILVLLPENSGWLNSLGSALMSKGDWDEAERYLRKAIACDASYGPAHFNLGNLLKDKGRIAEARDSYAAALRHSHDPAATFMQLGECSQWLNQFDRAIEFYKKALELNGGLLSAILTKITSLPSGRFHLRIDRLKDDLGYLSRTSDIAGRSDTDP